MVFIAAGFRFRRSDFKPFHYRYSARLSRNSSFSGIEYRIVCWCIINVVGFTWILRYAAKVKKNPQLSPVYEDDQYWRDLHNTHSLEIVYRTPKAAWVSFYPIGNHLSGLFLSIIPRHP